MKNLPFLIILITLCSSVWSQEKTILVEAESFKQKGGWVVDQQFMDIMGSPYLMAHGWGNVVADATTRVAFSETGKYKESPKVNFKFL